MPIGILDLYSAIGLVLPNNTDRYERQFKRTYCFQNLL